MLIVETLGAAPARRRLSRRPRAVDPGDQVEVPLTSAIVTGPERFEDAGAASAWLERVAGDPERRGAEVKDATRVLNRALDALRAAARDPLIQDVGATRALAVRIGFATGDELAEGRWSEARQLQPPRRRRLDDIDPQTRVAAVLAGRERVHPAETLLLRARLDADQGRLEEARYGLRAAAAAANEIAGNEIEDLLEEIGELTRTLDGDA